MRGTAGQLAGGSLDGDAAAQGAGGAGVLSWFSLVKRSGHSDVDQYFVWPRGAPTWAISE